MGHQPRTRKFSIIIRFTAFNVRMHIFVKCTGWVVGRGILVGPPSSFLSILFSVSCRIVLSINFKNGWFLASPSSFLSSDFGLHFQFLTIFVNSRYE